MKSEALKRKLSNCAHSKHTWCVTRPDDDSVPVFGALVLLVLVAALMYGLTLGLAALYAFRYEVSFPTGLASVRGQLLTLTGVQLAAMGTALAVGLRLFSSQASLSEALHLRPVKSRTLALSLLGGACLQFPLTELSNLAQELLGPVPLEQQLAQQNLLSAHSPLQGLVVLSCLAVLVPAAEELVFRGFLLFGLRRRYGTGLALLVSSCLFGLAHFSAVAAVYAAVAGLILGVLAILTRSVWPGIALHAAVNAVPVLLPEQLLPISGFNVPSATPSHLVHWLVWPPLLLAAVLLASASRVEQRETP